MNNALEELFEMADRELLEGHRRILDKSLLAMMKRLTLEEYEAFVRGVHQEFTFRRGPG